MGLQDTLKNARIGEEAKNAEIAQANRSEGRSEGRNAEQRAMAREVRQQEMLEAQKAQEQAMAMSILNEGRQQGVQAANRGYIDPMIEAQVPEGAIVPEMGPGSEQPEEVQQAKDIVNELNSLQSEGVDPRVLSEKAKKYLSKSKNPGLLKEEIFKLKQGQKNALKNANQVGGPQLNPTVEQAPVSPATTASKDILGMMAQDEEAKRQQIAQAQMEQQAQMQQGQGMA